MLQEPSVLLVDLPDKGARFAQALNQVGRPSAFITPDQLSNALGRGQPLGIVALARDVSQIAECIRAQNYPNQLAFFVLQADTPGSVRPPLPEVTAIVPEGVEPGILALRLQQALQQVGGPRPRQTTVLGIGSMSAPQEMPSQVSEVPRTQSIEVTPAPTKASLHVASALAPGSKSIPPAIPSPPAAIPSPPAAIPSPPAAIPLTVSSTRPAIPSSPPALSSTPPEVPWDDAPEPGIVSSVPPAAPKSQPSQPRPSAKPGVFSSAPPLPDIQALTPSAPFIPEAAPLSADVEKTLGELSSPPALSPPETHSATSPSAETSAETVPTHPPVALNPLPSPTESSSSWEDELGMKKRSFVPRALAVAGLLAALGVGGVVLVGGARDEAKKDSVKALPSATGAEAKDALGAGEPLKIPDREKSLANAPPEAVGEAALYKIENSTTMASCEATIGKSAADFAAAKKWRADQLWKQARKSLMAGQADAALKHMCEASFIDASGPATIGLAKYYLGRRGLEQAHIWATKAVDSAKGANSKRTAEQVLGDVLSQMGKVEEARIVWLRSFNLTADQADRLSPVVRNFVSAAIKARKGGDPALAEQLLRRATTFEPENANAAALLSAALLENGEKKLAKAWAERALSKKPGLEAAEEVLKSLGG